LVTLIHELSPDVIGKRLGRNHYNANGTLLLRKGVELNERYFNHFKERGYKSIFVLDNNPGEIFTERIVVPDKFIARAPFFVKKIFLGLSRNTQANLNKAKGELHNMAKDILLNVDDTVTRVKQVVDLKRQEDYLYQHSVNVAIFSILIGKQLQFHEMKLIKLAVAALLHDFGMLFIDPEIVNKETKLENVEFEKVKSHTTKGFSHLVRNCFFDGMATVASVQHHECFDGSGYPKNLSGSDIHEFSRIITLADFFDAWTSDRPHRRLNPIENAVEYIRCNENKIFDPTLVKAFMTIF